MDRALPSCLVACAIFFASGCGEEEDFGYYFESKLYGEARCNQPQPELAGRRLVRMFTHRSVEVTDVSRAMARYYRRYGFSFFTDRSAVVTDMEYALDTDIDALNALLAQEFPGVNLNDEAALMRDPGLYARILERAGNFMLRPIVEFARQHGQQGQGFTNLVVLPGLLRPGGAALGPPGASPAGLAVSPALIAALAAEGPEQAGVWPALDFPPDFTPMLFLHGVLAGQLSGIDPAVRDLIAAHEFGHTAGLIHREKEGNLMLPFAVIGRSHCSDTLDADQFATFRRNVGLSDSPRPLVAHRERARHPAVPPATFTALLSRDPQALRDFLAPVLHLEPQR
jgi:hypothetical protein